MNNKTNNHKTSRQLESCMTQQMPQLQQLSKSNTKQEELQQNLSQFGFVNLKDLSVDAFLRLQQMENPAYSIVFVNHIASKPSHIKLKVDGVAKYIPFYKIVRLEACSNYTRFHLTDMKNPILTSRTLKFYINQLSEDAFVRPHQSHLVNRHFIHQVELKPEPCLILKNGMKICIARRKLNIFRKQFL